MLASTRINQAAKKGLLAVAEAQKRAQDREPGPAVDKVPAPAAHWSPLAQQHFGPEEGFVLSRINGQWDVRSILKLCPMPDEDRRC